VGEVEERVREWDHFLSLRTGHEEAIYIFSYFH
jgi:hypothetical protein